MKIAIVRPFLWFLVLLFVVCNVRAQTWKQLDDKMNRMYSAGKIDSAIFYAEKKILAAEKEFGKLDTNYVSSLNNCAFLYEQKGSFSKAEPLFIEARSAVMKLNGENSNAYAVSLGNLAYLYYYLGEYVKAEPLFSEALSLTKTILGTNHPDYAACLNNLALLYYTKGEYAKAEPLYLESSAVVKQVNGTENKNYASSLNNLARLYRVTGKFEKAEPLFLQALAIRKKLSGPESYSYGLSLNDLGLFYEDIGIYSKAEVFFKGSVDISKKVLGTDNLDYAACLDNLAYLYFVTGDYPKAEPLFLEALAIRKKTLKVTHPSYAASLNNLASLYRAMGDYDKAEPLFLEVVNIRRTSLGTAHSYYAMALNNLASSYKDHGDYQKAEPISLEALSVFKKALGVENPTYAASLNNMAALYQDLGNYPKAEELYLAALDIRKKSIGIDHPDYAASLNNLGIFYESTGSYAKAEPFYNDALNIRKKALGPVHPDYAASLTNLALCYEAMGDYPKADPLFVNAQKIGLLNTEKSFGFLSEKEKEKYAVVVLSSVNLYQSFFDRYQKQKPSITKESYDIELVTKGMILSSGIQLRQSINAGNDKRALAIFDHWTSLKNTLAKLYAQPISKRQLNTDSIENLANEDEKQLTRLSASFRQGKLLTQANWKSVQQALGDHDVAVEFASFRYHTDKRWTDTTLYTALVLRKGDAYPAMVNLCREDELNKLLNKAGNTQSAFIGSLYRGGKIASTDTSAATRQKLYRLIWKPMEALLHKGDHIYYAPSGLLHQVAFAAIPREDGKLLSDRYQLTQLSSTAMLLQPVPVFTAKTLTVAAFGGIQYDASTTELAGIAVKDSQRFVSRSLTPDSTRSGSFAYLPGTLTEINNIDSLGKHYQVPVTLFTGINATEESYKKLGLGTSPQIIHISTHGFFFADPKKVNHNNAGILANEKQTFRLSDNPLNRSGLAFAGANHAWKGEAIPPGQEDGILTAYEASNVPLSNTRLVVLSACETGLGDIKGSEGVFGLQRAFKAAGATYLMMSLWQVPDTETAEFMGYFYKDLFAGQTIEKAFTSSQTTMKNKYRNDPYKWAAFVLMR